MIRSSCAGTVLAALLLAGCGGDLSGLGGSGIGGSGSGGSVFGGLGLADPPERREESDDERVRRLLEMRRAARENPGDMEQKARLRQFEQDTGARFLAAGKGLLEARQFGPAVQQFELGLLSDPANGSLQEARMTALGRKEAAKLQAEAQKAKATGNLDVAQQLLEKADGADRNNPVTRAELREVERGRDSQGARYLIKAFETRAPIAVNFRQAKLKESLQAVCEPYNLNFIFDRETEDLEFSVSARNVTFKQAFHMILQASNTAHKVVGPNSVLIYQNTPEKRAKYADLYFKTFHLTNVKAERMAELLKSSMDLKTMVANNDLNTIQVRDSRETLEVIERLVAANDRAPAEILLDVEILEINRSKAEQLGVDYGSQITLAPPTSVASAASTAATAAASTVGGVAAGQLVNGQFVEAVLGRSSVTLPSLTLKYMQKDVDAKVLAKPSIRTMDGKPAKIHVGDRVPLRSSTVQDVTGQTRTMFEYRDIGIRLDVLPRYHLDDTIAVELNLEVSALGNNLGTANEPAYAIGTRNVATTMLLREGEAAVLGGLIRDEERRTMNKVPGLSQLGVVGRLFAANDDVDARTDVLLTITPKVIRSQALPRRRDSNFYSGGQGSFTTESAYDFLKTGPSDDAEPPRYQLNPKNRDGVHEAKAEEGVPAGRGRTAQAASPGRPGRQAAAQAGFQAAAQAAPEAGEGGVEPVADAQAASPWLGFGAPTYAVQSGQTLAVDVRGANLEAGAAIRARVLFNPEKLDLVSGQGGKNGAAAVTEESPGVALVEIAGPAKQKGKAALAQLRLKAKSAGLSYLLLNTAGESGAPQLELGSSKIEVR